MRQRQRPVSGGHRTIWALGLAALFAVVVLVVALIDPSGPAGHHRPVHLSTGGHQVTGGSHQADVGDIPDPAPSGPPVERAPGSGPDDALGVGGPAGVGGPDPFRRTDDESRQAALADAASEEPGATSPLSGVPDGWTTAVHRLSVDGMTRSYLTIRPATTSPRVLPVVMVLHGRGMTPAAIERDTDLPMVTGPAILVYPAGYGRSWNAGGCCGLAHRNDIDDVTFLSAVADQVVATEPDTAPADVYLVGFSNGARMAYRLACALPGRWAGVGAVEAVPAASCPATTPVPMVILANPDDPFVHLHLGAVVQGYHEPSVAETVDEWRDLDGCSTLASTRELGIATAATWDDCRGNGQVTYALYARPGHSWPGVLAGFPGASRLVWSLLRYDRIPTVEGTRSR